MGDKSLLVLIPVSSLIIVITFSISNTYGLTIANNTYFSVQVPNGWVYTENYLNNNNTIVLAPNEFANMLITDNGSANLRAGLKEGGITVTLAPDLTFPIKNAPLETYVKLHLSQISRFVSKYENATVGGERAIKAYMNATDPTTGDHYDSAGYFVMHHDTPYIIGYAGSVKEYYSKFLPQFEQMVKSFKFTR